MRADLVKWDRARELAYVRDWNAGMTAEELRGKYGVKTPAEVASMLRQRGYVLTRRSYNNGRPGGQGISKPVAWRTK